MLDPKRFWASPAGAMPVEPTTQLGQEQAFHMQLGQLLTGSGPAPTLAQMEAFRQQMRGQLPPDAPPEMRRQAEEWLSQLASRRAQQTGAPLGGAWPGGQGVTEDQIAAWEKKHRVKLPKLLCEVLQLQNGGGVRDSDVCINALGGIEPVDTEMLFEELYEDEFADSRFVFEFASDGGEGIYLLDYNARGPNGEPAVYLDIRDCGELDKVANSVDKFFGKLLSSSDGAEVDWSEAARLTVVAREQIDLTGHYHGVPASTDQILCRDDKTLVLFVRRRVGEEETLTRTVLPEPLANDCSIQSINPGQSNIWTLNLQPRDSERIVQIESTRTSTGQWKNRTSHGVPIYEAIWSTDRDKLSKLRAELLGTKRAARVEDDENAELELQARLAALPPAAQRAALMQMAMQSQADSERLFQEKFPNIGEPPPEMAAIMALMQGKLQEMQRRAQEEAAQHPVDPELRKLMERMAKRLRPDAEQS
jgi:SMI1 / KNR4 family (SUKH-1)